MEYKDHCYLTTWLDGRRILRLEYCKMKSSIIMTKFHLFRCKQMPWSNRITLTRRKHVSFNHVHKSMISATYLTLVFKYICTAEEHSRKPNENLPLLPSISHGKEYFQSCQMTRGNVWLWIAIFYKTIYNFRNNNSEFNTQEFHVITINDKVGKNGRQIMKTLGNPDYIYW